MSEPVPTPTALRVRAGEQILGRRGQAFAVIDGGGRLIARVIVAVDGPIRMPS